MDILKLLKELAVGLITLACMALFLQMAWYYSIASIFSLPALNYTQSVWLYIATGILFRLTPNYLKDGQ